MKILIKSILAIAAAAGMTAATAASAATVTIGAGPTIGQIDGLGYHHKSVAGVTAAAGVTFDNGIGLHAAATRLQGSDDTLCEPGLRSDGGLQLPGATIGCLTQDGPRWADVSAGATYTYAVSDKLAIIPTVEAGRIGFMGWGAHSDYAAAGLGVSYAIAPDWALTGQLLHGRTRGVDTAGAGRLDGGQYQAGAMALIHSHPFGLPGAVSVSYSRKRWYVDTLPFGGDQYLRSDLLTVAYSQSF